MYDSMHSSKTWPCDYVKDILSRFLNMLQCSAGLGLEIADWKNVEMCFAKDIPQQQPGDTWNCGIFVLLSSPLLVLKLDDMFILADRKVALLKLLLQPTKLNLVLAHERLLVNVLIDPSLILNLFGSGCELQCGLRLSKGISRWRNHRHHGRFGWIREGSCHAGHWPATRRIEED